MPDPFARFAGTGLFALRASAGPRGRRRGRGDGRASRRRSRRLRARPPRPRPLARARRGGEAGPARRLERGPARPPPRPSRGTPASSRSPAPRSSPLPASPGRPSRRGPSALAWDAWTTRSPGTERARIASALGSSRSAATRAEAKERMAALVRDLPGRRRVGPRPLRASRPGAPLGDRHARQAPSCGSSGRPPSAPASRPRPPSWLSRSRRSPAHRLEAAALLLAGGRAKAARDALVRPPALAGRDEAERLRIEALLLAAELRLLGEPAVAAADAPRAKRSDAAFPTARRSGDPAPGPPEATVAAFRGARGPRRRAPRPRARPAGQATPPDGGGPRRGPLRPRRRGAPIPAGAPGASNRRRRSAPRSSSAPPSFRPSRAPPRRCAPRPPLSSGRPPSTATSPSAGGPTYWAARSLEALGPGRRRTRPLRLSRHDRRSRPLRPLGRRAARRSRLGRAPPRRRRGPRPFTPSGPDAPSLPSRELLAVGLASLAEDAAEAEGSAEPFFLAACAAERFEFRRADGAPEGPLAGARDAGRGGAAPGGPARLLPVPPGGAHRPRGGGERPPARARLRRHPPGEPLPDRGPFRCRRHRADAGDARARGATSSARRTGAAGPT